MSFSVQSNPFVSQIDTGILLLTTDKDTPSLNRFREILEECESIRQIYSFTKEFTKEEAQMALQLLISKGLSIEEKSLFTKMIHYRVVINGLIESGATLNPDPVDKYRSGAFLVSMAFNRKDGPCVLVLLERNVNVDLKVGNVDLPAQLESLFSAEQDRIMQHFVVETFSKHYQRGLLTFPAYFRAPQAHPRFCLGSQIQVMDPRSSTDALYQRLHDTKDLWEPDNEEYRTFKATAGHFYRMGIH